MRMSDLDELSRDLRGEERSEVGAWDEFGAAELGEHVGEVVAGMIRQRDDQIETLQRELAEANMALDRLKAGLVMEGMSR